MLSEKIVAIKHSILEEPANIVTVSLENEILIFDTGPDFSANWFKQVLEEATQKKIERIVVLITHYHWDHTAGFPKLLEIAEKKENLTLEVYAHSNTIAMISDLRNIVQWVERITRVLGEKTSSVIKAYSSSIAYIYKSISKHVEKLLALEKLKDEHLEYFACPGHTLCHTCYRVGNSLLIVGDTILSTSSPPVMDLEYYLESLAKILEEQWGKLAPGHGRALNRAEAVETIIRIASRKAKRARKIAEILEHEKSIGGKKLLELAYETRAKSYVELFTRAYNLIGYLEPLERRGAIEVSGENDALIHVRDREALRRYKSEVVSRLKSIIERAEKIVV